MLFQFLLMGLKPGVFGAACPLAEANGKRGSAYRICHKCLGYNELVNLLASVLTDREDYSLFPGFNHIIAGNSFSW